MEAAVSHRSFDVGERGNSAIKVLKSSVEKKEREREREREKEREHGSRTRC